MAGEQDVINDQKKRITPEMGVNSNAQVSNGNTTTVITASNNTNGIFIHSVSMMGDGDSSALVLDNTTTLKTGSGTSVAMKGLRVGAGVKVELASQSSGAQAFIDFTIL